jgi:hypothetical protein
VTRFIDLTADYWTDDVDNDPCCAFLSTNTNTFFLSADGCHVFHDLGAFEGIPDRDRLLAMLPEGFFGEDESEVPVPAFRAEVVYSAGIAVSTTDVRTILLGPERIALLPLRCTLNEP